MKALNQGQASNYRTLGSTSHLWQHERNRDNVSAAPFRMSRCIHSIFATDSIRLNNVTRRTCRSSKISVQEEVTF